MVSVELSGVSDAEYDDGGTGVLRESALEQILYEEDGSWKSTASLSTEFNQLVLEHGEDALPESSRVERVETVELDTEGDMVGIVVYMTGLDAEIPANTEDKYTTWVLEGVSAYDSYRIGLRSA